MEILPYPSTDVVNIDAATLKYEVTARFESTMQGGFNKPIFIFGAPGIGKTEIVSQVCEELNIELLTVDLQFMDPADFLGVPSVVEVSSDGKYGEGVT
jgi:Cdc6-like AAA superfamily ATPase